MLRRLPVEIQKSLKACHKEGAAASAMMVIMDYYLIPFALYLQASTQQIGLLIAIPSLLASISQLFAVRIVRAAGSRLNLLLRGIALQSVLMLPIAFLAFFHFSFRIETLIVLVAIFKIMGNVLGPAWGSLVSDYLPENIRGKYLGYRSRAAGIAAVAGIIFWGFLLYSIQKFSPECAFCLLFLGAAAFRFISYFYMKRMIDLPQPAAREHDFTFFMFVRRFRESNFVKFVFYAASITFATQLAVPYFNVYMLRDLHFDYLTYMAVNLCSIVSGLIAFPIWGRHADIVGNAKVLKLTSFFIPLIPWLWMISPHPLSLMAVEIFAGFVWGGFNLCSVNFIYDAVSPQKRVRCLGYFNLIMGAAVFLGAALGGYLAETLPPLAGSRLFSLFLLSGLIRFGADFFLSNHFKEVRHGTRKVSSGELFFSVAGIRPILGENIDPEVLPAQHEPEAVKVQGHAA